MENKPQSVFDKLDKQEEKIEDISSKLEGISIEDLYALAKRTWDYEDYQTAQKYYNHISLLRPLDWEAPLYASLCNFKGSHQVDFWEYGLNKASKVIISTINYINNLNISIDEKNNEINKCIDIIEDFLLATKNMYFKSKDVFDNYIPDFICKIESFYFDIYNETIIIELDSLNSFRFFIADNILDLVKITNKISPDITKEEFDKFIKLSVNKYTIDYNSICKSNETEQTENLSLEEKKEIMINGIMYFEYSDKVLSSREFKKNLTIGLALSLISIGGIVISYFGKWYWIFSFILSLFYGILLVIKAVTQKYKIKCSSLLCNGREKNRLTSEGNVKKESLFSPMPMISYFELWVSISTGIIMVIFAFSDGNSLICSIFYSFLVALNSVFSFINLFYLYSYSHYAGKYTYFYKGKNYNLK